MGLCEEVETGSVRSGVSDNARSYGSLRRGGISTVYHERTERRCVPYYYYPLPTGRREHSRRDGPCMKRLNLRSGAGSEMRLRLVTVPMRGSTTGG